MGLSGTLSGVEYQKGGRVGRILVVSWKIWQHCNEVVFKGQMVLADGFILSDVEGMQGGRWVITGKHVSNDIHINSNREFTDHWCSSLLKNKTVENFSVNKK